MVCILCAVLTLGIPKLFVHAQLWFPKNNMNLIYIVLFLFYWSVAQ